ncbi:hypothetical protein DPMN_102563 [Dreissena polymorpha]|uniref:Uncharacterized protein n=1 Tax=Dreissena polymorpha TaxID=45954 RepID=A0A9D4RAZ8_DREPO|nr:hypothetical protein DPMN_102563 [Dreissena polymorpha]
MSTSLGTTLFVRLCTKDGGRSPGSQQKGQMDNAKEKSGRPSQWVNCGLQPIPD